MEILRKHSPAPGLFSRRGFLTCAGATLLQTALVDRGLSRSASAQGLGGYPFTLGVASGDPLPHGIVLWTRLALDPLNGGGMPQHPIPVEWEIALDERLERVVQRGFARALPELGHSVHVEIEGLHPARWYWYRFRVGNEVSPIGRTKTAPPLGAALDELQFAFVSCQHYGNGYYPALRRMAEEDIDFAVHLGDYIYEGASNGTPRTHLPAREIVTIDDYRIRYAQYRSDPDLQAVHAAFPWIMTWDDHEVENDYAGFLPENPSRSGRQPTGLCNATGPRLPSLLRTYAVTQNATTDGSLSPALSAFEFRQSCTSRCTGHSTVSLASRTRDLRPQPPRKWILPGGFGSDSNHRRGRATQLAVGRSRAIDCQLEPARESGSVCAKRRQRESGHCYIRK
jgi:PhoD-like phosphatase/PhoD-like phosphatase, N-terminal domain